MSSREKILKKLRTVQPPFTPDPAPETYRRVTPVDRVQEGALRERFVAEAEALNCMVHQVEDDEAALDVLLGLLGEEPAVASWDLAEIPLTGLETALNQAHVEVSQHDDPEVRVGLSGVNAAVAATGSLILTSGGGRYRATSLVPPVHIAVVREGQLVPDLESWFEAQKATGLDKFREASNVIVISGPSRTADIAMELILGMHGPGELHIVFIKA